MLSIEKAIKDYFLLSDRRLNDLLPSNVVSLDLQTKLINEININFLLLVILKTESPHNLSADMIFPLNITTNPNTESQERHYTSAILEQHRTEDTQILNQENITMNMQLDNSSKPGLLRFAVGGG